VYGTQPVQKVNNIYVLNSLLLMNSWYGSAQYALRVCVKDQYGGLLWDCQISMCLNSMESLSEAPECRSWQSSVESDSKKPPYFNHVSEVLNGQLCNVWMLLNVEPSNLQ